MDRSCQGNGGEKRTSNWKDLEAERSSPRPTKTASPKEAVWIPWMSRTSSNDEGCSCGFPSPQAALLSERTFDKI